MRVGGVAQPIAQEVEGEHGDRDDLDAGQQQPRRLGEGVDVLGGLQQRGPGDGWRRAGRGRGS